MLAEVAITSGFLLALLFVWLKRGKPRPEGFPPGPQLLPLIGSISLLGSSSVQTIQQWRNRYGDIFGFQFGEKTVVVISDLSLIKEAFSEASLNGRPKGAGEQNYGLLHSSGPTWTQQRRFVTKNLRDFGFGKKTMESMTHEEIADLVNRMKESHGEPMSPHRPLEMATFNSLWHVVSGERLSWANSPLERIVESLSRLTFAGSETFALPGLEGLLPRLSPWSSRAEVGVPEIRTAVEDRVKEHKASYEDENLRDFMDVYLREIRDTKDPESSFFKESGDQNMLTAILNLLSGGVKTTSATLSWALYFLSNDLTTQKKFQEEIDQIVGHFRLSTLKDKLEMPYTEAVVLEVLRMSSLMPFGIPHLALKEVPFHGYSIPKDSLILPNLYHLHYSHKIWGDPNTFRPERFLRLDGMEIDKGHPPVVAFSLGKRSCLGETVSRDNVFLLLTSIFQRFRILADPNNTSKPKIGDGLLRTPPNFKVILQDRLEFLDNKKEE